MEQVINRGDRLIPSQYWHLIDSVLNSSFHLGVLMTLRREGEGTREPFGSAFSDVSEVGWCGRAGGCSEHYLCHSLVTLGVRGDAHSCLGAHHAAAVSPFAQNWFFTYAFIPQGLSKRQLGTEVRS